MSGRSQCGSIARAGAARSHDGAGPVAGSQDRKRRPSIPQKGTRFQNRGQREPGRQNKGTAETGGSGWARRSSRGRKAADEPLFRRANAKAGALFSHTTFRPNPIRRPESIAQEKSGTSMYPGPSMARLCDSLRERDGTYRLEPTLAGHRRCQAGVRGWRVVNHRRRHCRTLPSAWVLPGATSTNGLSKNPRYNHSCR